MNDNIRRLPGMQNRRRRLDISTGIVRCQVSDRWLQFPRSGPHEQRGTLLVVDVMTAGRDDEGRKLCELILTKQDLLAVLAAIQTEAR